MTPTKRKRRRPTLGYVLELERLLLVEQHARRAAQKEAETLAKRIPLLREEAHQHWVAKEKAEVNAHSLLRERKEARDAVARWLGVKVPA